MIYSAVWGAGDIWANWWLGREAIYYIFGCLGDRRYMTSLGIG